MTRVQRGTLVYISVCSEFRENPSDAVLTGQGKKTSKQQAWQSDELRSVREENILKPELRALHLLD